MSWTKREPVSNLVVLGDDEGNVKKVAGLLIDMRPDTMYPQRHNYEIVKKNGEVQVLAGSASLSRQIGPQDVGKFMKAEFTGWGKSANGKFKIIDVLLWEGEPTDEMKAWPRFKDLNGGKKKQEATGRGDGSSLNDFPEALEEEDDDSDDLPF